MRLNKVSQQHTLRPLILLQLRIFYIIPIMLPVTFLYAIAELRTLAFWSESNHCGIET